MCGNVSTHGNSSISNMEVSGCQPPSGVIPLPDMPPDAFTVMADESTPAVNPGTVTSWLDHPITELSMNIYLSFVVLSVISFGITWLLIRAEVGFMRRPTTWWV